MNTVLQNCDIFTGDHVVANGEVVVSGDRIVGVTTGRARRWGRRDTVLDLKGASVAPGYVDIQVNGGGGVLFNQVPTPEGLATIVAAHRGLGTTSIVPTFITGAFDGMASARAAAETIHSSSPSAVLGVQFEGPVLSQDRLGVHDRDHIKSEFPGQLVALKDGFITIVTVAPEVAGGMAIRDLRQRGARVALGHSNATYPEFLEGVESGGDLVTHLFNAMRGFSGRDPGIVGGALVDDRVYVDLIPDGHHVDFVSVMLAWKIKPRGRCFFVTDAMPPVGSSSANYVLGSLEIFVRDGRCVTADGVLAGSALDMGTGVRNAVTRAGIGREEAFKMGSTYPADYLGLGDRVGRVKEGAFANLVIVDNGCNVLRVMFEGEFV